MMHPSSEFEQRIDFYADPFSIGNLLTGFHAIVDFCFTVTVTLCAGDVDSGVLKQRNNLLWPAL